MTILRNPPSGPPFDGSLGQTTSEVSNDSTVSGATMTAALDSLSARLDTLEQVLLFEEFLGGADASTATSDLGLFGDLGWSFYSTGGSPSLFRPTDNNNYFGAYGITASASQISALAFGDSTTPPTSQVALNNNRYTFLEFLAIPDIGDSPGAFGTYAYGLSNSALSAALGDNSLRLEINRAVSNNWRFVTRVANVDTVLSSSIPYVPHALVRLRLERNATTGSWTGSVNGVTIGTFTSAQVAAVQQMACAQVQATAASAQSLAVDRLSMGFNAI